MRSGSSRTAAKWLYQLDFLVTLKNHRAGAIASITVFMYVL